MLDLGLDLDVWPWIWLAVAVAFALIELTVLGGSFVLLPFALSAFAAMLLAFYDVAVEVQWAVFVLGGGLLFFVFYRLSTRFVRDNALPPGVGAERLIGAVGVVTVGVDPDDAGRQGRVSVQGETWGALAHSLRPIGAGVRVRVMAMQGTRLVVEPAEQTDETKRPTEEEPS